MTISKRDMEEILSADMDVEVRRTFLAMSREEQLLAILGMLSYSRSEMAIVKKTQIEFGQDLGAFKKELREVRRERERREQQHEDDLLTTTQKIAREITKAFSSRFDFWTWARDRILPPIVIAFILGLLYLVFGGKLP